jgi:N-acyl amino acid synthase of PEP-CTERM/exosortase system
MFDDNFEVFLADTPESEEIHYSIRYQVYCEEMGFENKEDFPSEQEFDEYDSHSTHFIVRTRQTGQWVGAMRMIFKKDQLLPLEKHCTLNATIKEDIFNRSIEISRLCLVKDIRRRSTDIDPPLGLGEDGNEIKAEDNVIPFHRRKHAERSIIWGLFRAAALHSKERDIKKWYFLGTNALARIICKTGCNMKLIGESCNINGERFPFEMIVNEILSNSLWLNDFKNGYSLYSGLEMSATDHKNATSAGL